MHVSRRGKREATATYSDENDTLTLYIGFKLDALPKYENLTRTLPNLNLNLVDTNQVPQFPSGDSSNVPIFDPDINKTMQIKVKMNENGVTTKPVKLLFAHMDRPTGRKKTYN